MKNITKFENYQPEENKVPSDLKHQKTNNYMFFANLQTIQRYIDDIMNLSQEEVDDIISEHDWASDHMSVACENLEHVHNFLVNHGVSSNDDDDEFDAEYEEEEEDDNEDDDENEYPQNI